MRSRGTLSGNKIGKYAIEEVLGQGGMGTVYLARHEVLEHEVALKVLRRDVSLNPKLVQRFFLEAKAVAKLRAPGLAHLHDYGHTEDGRAYIVMEYLEGETLLTRLKSDKHLAEEQLLRLAVHIARTLAVVHSKGIVHRDLKPDNIFVVKDDSVEGGERVKILDFGVAKLNSITKGSIDLTMATELLGTPLYMAPEQWRGAALVTTSADIYSLGCILYHCLCGLPPFTGDNLGQICAAHIAAPPKAPSQHRAGITPAVEELVLRCLEKIPKKRPGSMKQLAAELSDVLAKLGSAPATKGAAGSDLGAQPVSKRSAAGRPAAVPRASSGSRPLRRRQSRTVPVSPRRQSTTDRVAEPDSASDTPAAPNQAKNQDEAGRRAKLSTRTSPSGKLNTRTSPSGKMKMTRPVARKSASRKPVPRTTVGMALPKLPAHLQRTATPPELADPPTEEVPATDAAPASAPVGKSRKTSRGTLRMSTPAVVRSVRRPGEQTPEPDAQRADPPTSRSDVIAQGKQTHKLSNTDDIDTTQPLDSVLKMRLDDDGELPTQRIDDVGLASFLREQFAGGANKVLGAAPSQADRSGPHAALGAAQLSVPSQADRSGPHPAFNQAHHTAPGQADRSGPHAAPAAARHSAPSYADRSGPHAAPAAARHSAVSYADRSGPHSALGAARPSHPSYADRSGPHPAYAAAHNAVASYADRSGPHPALSRSTPDAHADMLAQASRTEEIPLDELPTQQLDPEVFKSAMSSGPHRVLTPGSGQLPTQELPDVRGSYEALPPARPPYPNSDQTPQLFSLSQTRLPLSATTVELMRRHRIKLMAGAAAAAVLLLLIIVAWGMSGNEPEPASRTSKAPSASPQSRTQDPQHAPSAESDREPPSKAGAEPDASAEALAATLASASAEASAGAAPRPSGPMPGGGATPKPSPLDEMKPSRYPVKMPLYQKALQGKASESELRMLKGICMSEGDKPCRNLAAQRLKALRAKKHPKSI